MLKLGTRARGILFLAILLFLAPVILATIASRRSFADVDDKYDWKNKKRTLHVCVKTDNCPANMADSVKAAINLWNKKLKSWKLVFDSTNCTNADVTIKCGKIKGLGLWQNTSGSYGASTENTITISKDAEWGYCNDKYEIVSTIAHELGHAMRLNDVSSSSELMRGEQGKAGHLRGPTSKDSTEAATSDSTKKANAQTTPPGGKRQYTYDGVITPTPDSGPFNLDQSIGVEVSAFRPQALMEITWEIMSNDEVRWVAYVTEEADETEAFFLTIMYPDSIVIREGLLHVVEPDWDPGWLPTAVVTPPDTTVPYDTCMIVLDASRSYHPALEAGYESPMIYRWIVDGGDRVIKGEPITSTYLPMGDHYITLEAMDEFGNVSTADMHVLVEQATDVGMIDVPKAFELAQNYPNPFNPYTEIRFRVPTAGKINLSIYDARGRLVKTLLSGYHEAGSGKVTWDGKSNSGQKVASGLYFCRLVAGKYSKTIKVVLLR